MRPLSEHCEELFKILPTLREGWEKRTSSETVNFCNWCIREFNLADGEEGWIQELVLARMSEDEIELAYARWCIEEENHEPS